MCTSNNQSTEAPTRKMSKRARLDGGMSNRKGCPSPGEQDEMMAQKRVVAVEVVSEGTVKRCHGAKTNSLAHNWPWGARKRKVPRMTPTLLAFEAGEAETHSLTRAMLEEDQVLEGKAHIRLWTC